MPLEHYSQLVQTYFSKTQRPVSKRESCKLKTNFTKQSIQSDWQRKLLAEHCQNIHWERKISPVLNIKQQIQRLKADSRENSNSIIS